MLSSSRRQGAERLCNAVEADSQPDAAQALGSLATVHLHLEDYDAADASARKALRVGAEEYIFSARNETTKDVLTWKPSSGVRKFVISDASEIGEFRVQFQSNDAARAINWGAPFERQAGNCYWVNAIRRN